ncbi:MAG: hypothetical protein KJS70_00295 [Actinomycetales bacterium]|nr:hypothetical protein [Actinomycetales bacterium]
MEFSITKGNPTPEELEALKVAMAQHKREELKPVIRRSIYGLPQLRQGLPHQITFGARKNS